MLSHNAEIPSIFHKSLEELNDVESVHEEIDFIATRQTVAYDQQNGHSGLENHRPSSENNPPKERKESSHKRPLSLSNIQIPRDSISGPNSPIKHVEFVKESMLLKRIQQKEYSRANSHNVAPVSDGVIIQQKVRTHRRTQSSIPFGYSGEN